MIPAQSKLDFFMLVLWVIEYWEGCGYTHKREKADIIECEGNCRELLTGGFGDCCCDEAFQKIQLAEHGILLYSFEFLETAEISIKEIPKSGIDYGITSRWYYHYPN